jgi:NADPH2:quinone reductase
MAWSYDAVFVRDGFVEATLAATEGRGVDVILDPIGGAIRAASWEALARFGRLVHFGNASMEPEVVPSAVDLRARGHAYVGYSGGQHAVADLAAVRASWLEGVELVADGSVTVPVHAVLPLEEAAEAHRLLESGDSVGKIVLRVA